MPLNTFQQFALDQLARTLRITHKRMFGGVGIYADGLFFALMDADRLWLKVDDVNRPDFASLGLRPFEPDGPGGPVMQYYPVPEHILEDPDTLREWAGKALDVARRAKRKKR